MTNLKQILYLSTLGLLFASCASYGVISDNDVYLQKPAAIDLTDDQEDITSFNAYKAGRQGAFQNGDPRLRNTNANIFIAHTNPFAFNNSMFNPYYGYNDPFAWNRPFGMYNSYGPGWGYGWGYGYHGYGYGYNHMYSNTGFFYNGYQYGTFLSPYYGHNHYGINYIGPNSSYYGTNSNNGNSSFFGSGSTNQFYGKRTNLSTSSRRSSSYPETLKNKMHNNVKPSNSSVLTKDLSPQNIQNRRTVSNSEREYVRSNVNINRNSSRPTSYDGSNRSPNTSAINQRRTVSSENTYRDRSFSPSNSARRSGTVNRSNADRRTTGNYNSSNNVRRSTNSAGNDYNRGSSFSSPQRSSGSSINRSSGSSSRSSGSSSSRGSSSSSGRR